MTSALLVIDLQEDFFQHDRLVDRRSALTRATNDLVQICREHACHVVWVTQEFADDLHDAPHEIRSEGIRIVVAGTDGAALLKDFKPQETDFRIIKKRYSAFYGTALDELLARLEVSRLLIAGVNTHACVRTTVVDAYQRDYEVVLASECIDSHDVEHHDVSWRYMDGKLGVGMSNEEVQKLLTDEG